VCEVGNDVTPTQLFCAVDYYFMKIMLYSKLEKILVVNISSGLLRVFGLNLGKANNITFKSSRNVFLDTF
jgi:hypothetical protein